MMYYKKQFYLIFFILIILFLLGYKFFENEKIKSNGELVKVMIINKVCEKKGLGRRNKNKNTITFIYNKEKINIKISYKKCQFLNIGDKLELIKNPTSNSFIFTESYNFDTAFYLIFFILLVALIPFKLFLK